MGLPAAMAAAVGLVVASSTLVMMGQGFGIAGPGFLIVMGLALLINLFVAFSLAELAGMMPRAGSINHYTQAALGPFIAIMAVACPYLLASLMFAGSAEASIPGIIMRDVFVSWMPAKLFSIVLIVVLLLVNLRGIVLFSVVQIFTASLMIVSLIVVGLIGLFGLGQGTPVVGAFADFNPMGTAVFSLVAMAFWLFVGIEFVTPLAEEIKRPRLYIPLAMILGLLIILVAKGLYGFAALKYVGAEALAGSQTPHVDVASAVLGRNGQIWLALASILATVTTVNTLLAATPRMLYGMAQKGQAPAFFGKLNRYSVPWVATVFGALLILTPLALGASTLESFVVYILAASLLWVTGYIVLHIDLLILRRRHGSPAGGFKTPLYPLPQLLSLAGLVWMVFNISPDPAMSRQIYTYAGIFLVGAAIYAALWVTLKEKKGLFERTPLEELAGDLEVEPAAPSGVLEPTPLDA
jgi:amino acid transporter